MKHIWVVVHLQVDTVIILGIFDVSSVAGVGTIIGSGVWVAAIVEIVGILVGIIFGHVGIVVGLVGCV